MQLHQLKRQHPQARKKIVGRGGKRGTTAGRGTKGQKARAGHRIRPELRDIIKKLPKKRGSSTHGVFRSQTVPARVVNLALLEQHFSAGETVSPKTLRDKGLVGPVQQLSRRRGSIVKILGDGRLTVKLTVEGCRLSRTAAAAVTAAGGQIIQTKHAG
ncbi:MAG: uL15 family ribosomal protein [Patescibacteria group bacterium]